LAFEESWALKAVTPKTFSSIIHLITKNTPEQVRTSWKPPTNLSELTISCLDPLVMEIPSWIQK
jgi:hypothetical protein